ncbi:MAG: UDP-N-acetylmuramate--alanine ligase [Clostridiales bacterium]|nr:UDP-N-acetylmuramate--alanine ligase [Clostridiales bacterium]
MSGFAELLHTMGFTITGSDHIESEITDHLSKLGIKISYEQIAANINPSIDLVVYTAAIHEDNEEYIAAKEAGIPMMDRAQMVGQVMKNYECAIAVSGTHGKTTTTSMISHIMLAGNLDPTISVGGILKSIDGNIRIGASKNFITEACEYTNSFLKFHPTIGVILNIEEEHLDFFKDLNDIRGSFHSFARLLPENGLLVINGEIDSYKELAADLSARFVSYGLEDDTYQYTAKNIQYNEFAQGSFDLYKDAAFIDRIVLKVIGRHNISNALAAIAVGYELNIPIAQIKEGLSTFAGTNRRFEYKGEIGGITIIDDYAHHPTEIYATLSSAKAYPANRMWCVFQPHTYSRTRAFLKEFATSLALADVIVLTDIYSAREQDPGDISSIHLKEELEKLGKEVYYFPSFDEVENFLLENCTNGDLLITMGAGNIVTVGETLLGL